MVVRCAPGADDNDATEPVATAQARAADAIPTNTVDPLASGSASRNAAVWPSSHGSATLRAFRTAAPPADVAYP